MKKYIGYVCIILAAAGWSTLGIYNRALAAVGMSVYSSIGLRLSVTALLMTVFCVLFKRHVFRIQLRHLPIFLGNGLISMLLLSLTYFIAQQLCSLAVASILMYLAPSFVAIFAAIAWKTPLTGKRIFALALALVGCALVSGIAAGGISVSVLGLIAGAVSGMCYAGYTIFSHYGLKHYDTLTVTYWTFLIAGIGAAFLADWPFIFANVNQPNAAISIVCMSLVGTIMPFVTYTLGLERVESSRAAMIANIEPVFVAIIGALVFHETLDLWSIIGMVCVLGGVMLLSSKDRKRVNP
jgi:drug/metabolite transporter (DMT)-like permease